FGRERLHVRVVQDERGERQPDGALVVVVDGLGVEAAIDGHHGHHATSFRPMWALMRMVECSSSLTRSCRSSMCASLDSSLAKRQMMKAVDDMSAPRMPMYWSAVMRTPCHSSDGCG